MMNRWRSQLGATAVEYALMVALIAVVTLGAVATLGQSIFGEDVEVLGNVLTRDAGDSEDILPPDGGQVPACEVAQGDPAVCQDPDE